MNHDANEFWEKVSPGLRRSLKWTPPTLSEAEAEFNAAKAEPLSENQIQSILHYAKTGRRKEQPARRSLLDWLKDRDLTQITQDMVPALARNAGVNNEEVEDLLNKLREEALRAEGQDTHDEEQPETSDNPESREQSD